MGQAVSRKGRDSHTGDADPNRDSSVHSCRSVHPEEPVDLAVLQEISLDNDIELGHHRQVTPDLQHTHPTHQEDNTSFDRSNGQLDNSNRGRDKQDAEQQVAVPIHRTEGVQEQSLSNGIDEHEHAQQQDSRGSKGILHHIRGYLSRMRGDLDTPIKVPQLLDMALGWLGAFISILIIAVMNNWLSPQIHFDFLIASFGASAVLLFGASEGKMSQPRNLIGGHVVSAIVGCTVRVILRDVIWLSAALGMSIALVIMHLTSTLHPPGGATALIAATATNYSPGQGYRIVLAVLIDSLIMLVVALGIDNIRRSHRYPTYWW